ncbi:unnamed protein product [Allacma fusca]|uniref:Uncharacterized protein n=1 Tax=Allacma fusca TaxID=39272 RepID=A0A8J2JXU0_9HEXA|nr:unnamed protein product [Allacma fusca]
MPPRKAIAEPAEKDLYLFLGEADVEKGIHENHAHVITKLLSDKVFSESSDSVAVSTLDKSDFQFDVPSWDMLRSFNEMWFVPSECAFSSGAQFIGSILQACETVGMLALEDTYTKIKVLVFANFSDYVLDAHKLEELKQKVEADNILLTLM